MGAYFNVRKPDFLKTNPKNLTQPTKLKIYYFDFYWLQLSIY